MGVGMSTWADQLSDEHIDDLGLLKPLVVDLATR